MDLILWRHAEAADARDTGADEDLKRPLTSKGERQAARMAEWLNHRLAASTRIVVSPAVRAQQTAAALGRKFRTVDAVAPDAAPEDVLRAAKWPDASEPVLVVGHQPTLGAVAALLLGNPGHSLSIKKGAVWWLRRREREGDGEVVLQAVQAPDCL
jgi:phosphohistidine phosphatase